jgi:DNA-binding transcriptional LysR family regulator
MTEPSTTPSLRQIRTFLAAVELGSVTDAARSLNLTQPAASQQLREMERLPGVRLLERAEGRVIPTATGAAILDAARQAQTAAASLTEIAASCRSGDFGRVRLGTGATACIYLLPPALAAARQRMPGLEIVVVIGNSPDMLRRIEEGSLDAGLVSMPRALPSSLAAVTLRQDPLVALLPEAWDAPAEASPEWFAARPLILYESGSDTRGVVDAWFRQAGLAAKPAMELGSVEAIKVLVSAGLGAAILPKLALNEPVPGTRQCTLNPPAARGLGLVLRKGKILDRGLRVLTECVEAMACSP